MKIGIRIESFLIIKCGVSTNNNLYCLLSCKIATEGNLGIVVGHCGSLWVVVGRCGVIVGRCGVVVGRCGSFHVLVTTGRRDAVEGWKYFFQQQKPF